MRGRILLHPFASLQLASKLNVHKSNNNNFSQYHLTSVTAPLAARTQPRSNKQREQTECAGTMGRRSLAVRPQPTMDWHTL